MPELTASSKPQPDQPVYGLDALELYPRLTRATYSEYFGVQPPTWDRQRRIQPWFDSNAAKEDPNGVYNIGFYAIGRDGEPRWAEERITNRDAAVPNLPGQYAYPKWHIEPTGATIVSPFGGRTPFGADILSMRSQADVLADELRESGYPIEDIFESTPPGFSIDYPPHEHRRPWMVRLEMSQIGLTVGKMLKVMWDPGIGSPGRWAGDEGSLQWKSEIPADVGEWDLRPTIPIPQRVLFDNEDLITGFGNVIQVRRKDMAEGMLAADTAAMPARTREILGYVKSIHREIAAAKAPK